MFAVRLCKISAVSTLALISACTASPTPPPPPPPVPAPGQALQPAPVCSTGRVCYTVTNVPAPAWVTDDDYVGMKLQISANADPSALGDPRAPNFLQNLWSGINKNTVSVFLGVRFVATSSLSQGANNASAASSQPFTVVLQDSETNGLAAPGVIQDGEQILDYRPIDEPGVTLQIAQSWDNQVNTKIPSTLIQFAMAAVPYANLPAAAVKLIDSAHSAQRSAADTEADNLFSNSSGSMTAPSINYDYLASDLKDKMVTVDFYDRSPSDKNRKLIIEFTITPEYRPSLLTPQDDQSPPEPAKLLYATWQTSATGSRDIVEGLAGTSPLEMLDKLPGDSPISTKLMRSDDYEDACLGMPQSFQQLGYNTADSYALTWAVLNDPHATYLGNVAAGDNDAISDCPDASMNAGFAADGLGRVASPREIAASLTTKQIEAVYGSYPPDGNDSFAQRWARRDDESAFFNPANKEVDVYQDSGPFPTPINSPFSGPDFAKELDLIQPTKLEDFTPVRGRNEVCMVLLAQGKYYRGRIYFSSPAASSPFVSEVDVGNYAECNIPEFNDEIAGLPSPLSN